MGVLRGRRLAEEREVALQSQFSGSFGPGGADKGIWIIQDKWNIQEILYDRRNWSGSDAFGVPPGASLLFPVR